MTGRLSRVEGGESGADRIIPFPLCRSGTDFSVFVDVLGMRGLDVAFYQPRSRYHTTEDDARHCRFPLEPDLKKAMLMLRSQQAKGHSGICLAVLWRPYEL